MAAEPARSYPSDAEIRRYLCTIAAQNDGTITYGAVNARFGHCWPWPSSGLFEALDRINRAEHAHGRPLLSAVVVTGDTELPGAGFFTMARRLGYPIPEDRDAERAFWTTQALLAHLYWADRASRAFR